MLYTYPAQSCEISNTVGSCNQNFCVRLYAVDRHTRIGMQRNDGPVLSRDRADPNHVITRKLFLFSEYVLFLLGPFIQPSSSCIHTCTEWHIVSVGCSPHVEIVDLFADDNVVCARRFRRGTARTVRDACQSIQLLITQKEHTHTVKSLIMNHNGPQSAPADTRITLWDQCIACCCLFPYVARPTRCAYRQSNHQAQLFDLNIYNITKIPFNLRHDHPRMSTLTRWHSYATMSRIPWRYTGCARTWTAYVKAFQSYCTTACECMHLVRRGHFLSRDKDGSHTIGSTIPENFMLHANLMALSFVEPVLWAIEVYIAWIGSFDIFCSCAEPDAYPWRYTGCAYMNFLLQGLR